MHPVSHDNQIQVQANHGLGVRVDGQAADDTIVRPRLPQQVQQEPNRIDPAVRHSIQECLARHGISRILPDFTVTIDG
jgi:hypothetical protein